MTEHQKILRKVGISLISIGILDIISMFFWLMQSREYSSSLNIFVVIGGLLLLRENFRAIETVSFFSAFFFAAHTGIMIATTLTRPLSYWQNEFSEKPLFTAQFILTASIAIFFWWVFRQLTSAPILEQRRLRGLDNDRSFLGFIFGMILSLVACTHLLLESGNF